MFILLLDEPCLFVFPSEFDVQCEVEPPDAEDTIRAAFDENAVPYRLEWTTPNRRQRWFFGLESIRFGHYRLVPAGPPNRAALLALLEQHNECTHPPEAHATLNTLLENLRSA
jgi:hypothetical protein